MHTLTLNCYALIVYNNLQAYTVLHFVHWYCLHIVCNVTYRKCI